MGLVRQVRRLDGYLFYYADEKPPGTPKQTSLDPGKREADAMREALNRIARHAERCQQNVMVIIDQVNEKTRAERLPIMYGHILGRAEGHPEMRRIIEPPTHVDSVLSANVQFADWIAACVTRAIDYQLIRDSPFGWVAHSRALSSLRGAFTHESKLHLYQRSVDDINNSAILNPVRVVHPTAAGQLVGAGLDPTVLQKIHAAAVRADRPSRS